MREMDMTSFFTKKKKKQSTRSLRVITDSNMPFAYVEAYKSLRTNLNFISATSGAKSFVITSALPEESKSNVSVNTAIALAAGEKKVVIVDCDLRKPILHRYLKMGRSRKGLTNVLAGDAALDETIVSVKNLGIDVLVAGAVPPNPSELLATEQMRAVVEQLAARYDYVILDAPPVSVVTDAAVLGTMVDGALLVIRSKYASREAVQLAKKKLTDVNVKVLGAILSRYDMKRSSKHSGYSYSYNYEYSRE